VTSPSLDSSFGLNLLLNAEKKHRCPLAWFSDIMPSKEPTLVHRKIALLGFRAVGKSSLTHSFVTGAFSEAWVIFWHCNPAGFAIEIILISISLFPFVPDVIPICHSYDPTIESTHHKTIRFRKVHFATDIVDTAGMVR
jgi:Ras family protein